MLTELRRYSIEPGHMAAMHRRMTDVLIPLFDELGIPRPRSIWESVGDEPVFSWLVDWPDYEARAAGWARIAPLFAAARKAEGTPEFVTRTNLTLIAPWPGHQFGFAPVARCETAWHVQAKIGYGVPFLEACEADVFSRFRDSGARVVNAANLVFGALPQAVILLSWPDAATRSSAMRDISGQPMPGDIRDALLGEGATFGERGQWEALDRAPYIPAPATT